MTGTILGAQAVGGDGVDKRIDVIATAITGGITADESGRPGARLRPPFSSAKDPVNMLGYMAENVRSGACDVVEYDELDRLIEEGWTVVDVRTREEHGRGAIPGSINLPLDQLREELDGHQRSLRRLLRGRPTGSHGDVSSPRNGNRGTKPRRRLSDMDRGRCRPSARALTAHHGQAWALGRGWVFWEKEVQPIDIGPVSAPAVRHPW